MKISQWKFKKESHSYVSTTVMWQRTSENVREVSNSSSLRTKYTLPLVQYHIIHPIIPIQYASLNMDVTGQRSKVSDRTVPRWGGGGGSVSKTLQVDGTHTNNVHLLHKDNVGYCRKEKKNKEKQRQKKADRDERRKSGRGMRKRENNWGPCKKEGRQCW